MPNGGVCALTALPRPRQRSIAGGSYPLSPPAELPRTGDPVTYRHPQCRLISSRIQLQKQLVTLGKPPHRWPAQPTAPEPLPQAPCGLFPWVSSEAWGGPLQQTQSSEDRFQKMVKNHMSPICGNIPYQDGSSTWAQCRIDDGHPHIAYKQGPHAAGKVLELGAAQYL